MNKLSKIVGTVCISLMGSIGSASADASAFTGAYVAVTGSAVGMALDGTKTRTVTGAKTTKGKIGMVSPAAGLEIGFSYPITDMFFVTVGAALQPFDTEVDAKNVTDSKNIKLASNDIETIFIEPSFNVTENSAFFLKLGHSESNLDATGTAVTNASYSFSGTTIALGTKTISDNGMFFKTEAGMTDYDSITITGVQERISESSDTLTATVKADVEAAYGQMTIGFKF
jgi:hypothetical protein